ncbi:MAG TPA: response regulator transcription factor [Gaiellaceae bacterium]|nr:response regulator transcription factor [Gaiellaceae bacterium]
MSPRVLIAEDEAAIADSVAYALRGEGFDVDTVDDGESALDAARADGYDVLLLDLMLPGVSGMEVCRRLRAESAIPILMLTARTAEVERVLGLEAGADDYVVKPFSMPELISRVRAILRRRQLDHAQPSVLTVGTLTLDVVSHTAAVDGELVRLTPSEFKLLTLFVRHPDRVFSRRELMQHLWDSSYVGDQRAGDAHIVNLRRKIGGERLVTVRGVGYKLAAL